MEYAPPLTSDELAALANIVGADVQSERRVLGGQSATTDIIRSSDGARFALRRHGRWSIGFDDDIATREAGVMALARASGVPVPRVVWAGGFADGTATLTEFVEGRPVIDPTTPGIWVDQLASVLGKIHSVEVTETVRALMDAAPPQPAQTPLGPAVEAHPRASEIIESLEANTPAEGTPLVFVHGDFWPGNLLWNEGDVVAVLDWELATTGDPARDVAYLATELGLLGFDGYDDQLIATYQSFADSDLSNLAYWRLNATSLAIGDLPSYLDGWSPLGVRPSLADVTERLDHLVDEALAKTAD